MESDVHSSLYEKCHHQIIKAKLNFKTYYPPLYEREIRNNQTANKGNIREAIDQFPQAMRFTNIELNEKLNLFNKTIKNIILNYIPHETINCDGRDLP